MKIIGAVRIVIKSSQERITWRDIQEIINVTEEENITLTLKLNEKARGSEFRLN